MEEIKEKAQETEHEECCCGHEHHHDHEHEHHHRHENIEITTHEESVTASVRIVFREGRGQAEVMLRSFMRAVAEETEALGGTIGHIKFFLKESRGSMFSMTDTDEIQKKEATYTELRAEGVAIVLGLTPEQLENIVAVHYPGAI